MSFMEEKRPVRRTAHDIGSDLSQLSVDELDARIGLLKDEILRLEAEKETKAKGRSAADKLFRS